MSGSNALRSLSGFPAASFVPIGELAMCSAGATPSSTVEAYWEGGTIPWMSSGEVNKGTVYETDKRITQAAYDSCSTKMLPANVVVVALAGQGKTRGMVARTRIPLCTNQSLAAIVPSDDRISSDFLYYFLKSQYSKLREVSSGDGTRGGLNLQMIRAYKVPVPPKEVQQEIVAILEQFAELQVQLELELDARKRLRLALTNNLLAVPELTTTDEAAADKVRLGELAKRCIEPIRVMPAGNYSTLGVKWYGEGVLTRPPRSGATIKGTTLYCVKPGQLIYNRMFVTEGSFAIVPTDVPSGVVSSEFPVYDLDTSRVLPEWLMLYFQDQYTLTRIATEATGVERGSTKSRRRWKEDQFEAFEISLPPMGAQREIHRIVGSASALESNLRDELAARRKQYEYYRDKLLTFEEAPA
jgi:type I restriction enzyme, S subunit